MALKKAKIVELETTGTELIEQPTLPFQSIVFHYNTFTQTWHCIKRENYVDYFNGINKHKIGKGKTLPECYRNLFYNNFK